MDEEAGKSADATSGVADVTVRPREPEANTARTDSPGCVDVALLTMLPSSLWRMAYPRANVACGDSARSWDSAVPISAVAWLI